MRFQGLGRKENPTERAIVEVVHPDGTYDCRVPGRPHPYTRLQTCGGQRPLHVGQTVEVAFVDYQRTGRRWMPFILGASKSHLESGMSRGRVSRGLSWHNGVAGTPDYTGSLYSLDTGYRPWKLDAGWSIPGPWVSIIGYTVDQGYILTVHGKDVRCYLAENGAPAWEYELPQEGSRPVYNPARREVVLWGFFGDDLRVEAILDAVSGRIMAGSHSLDYSGNGYPYVWADKILYPARSRWNVLTGDQKPSSVWTRNGSAGYTSKREFYLTQTDISWGNGYWGQHYLPGAIRWTGEMFISGKRLYYYSDYQNSDKLPDTYREDRAWRCLGVLDLDTESSAIVDNTFGTPEPIGGYGAYVDINPVVVTRDGYLHGVLEGRRSPSILSYRFLEWGPDGHRTFEGPIVQGITNASSPDFLGAPKFDPRLHSRDLVVASIVVGVLPPAFATCVLQDGSPLWTLPAGDSFSGHGGESTRGEAPWVLVYSQDGYHFRDFRTGAVLGPWAGRTPVMVSAGIIYDKDDDGNLRRWTE